jgi:hypothetical protein
VIAYFGHFLITKEAKIACLLYFTYFKSNVHIFDINGLGYILGHVLQTHLVTLETNHVPAAAR